MASLPERLPWSPSGSVFALQGAHTGDLVMAMPAIGAALKRGPVGVAGLKPQYYAALQDLPVHYRVRFHDGRRLVARRTAGLHMTEVWLRCLGEDVAPVRLPFPVRGNAQLDRLLPFGPWVLLSPWSDFAPKRWDPGHWHLLAGHIAASGWRVAVTGPPRAAELGRFIAGPIHLNLVGRDGPEDWPGLLRRAALVISTDSAPVHVADAMDIPVIGLYGHTRIDEFGPFWRRDLCVQAGSMEALGLGTVIEAFERWRRSDAALRQRSETSAAPP